MPGKRKRCPLSRTVVQLPLRRQHCGNVMLQPMQQLWEQLQVRQTPQWERRPRTRAPATARCACNCVMNVNVLHAPTPSLLTRHMERQMELCGQMNTLYGINYYDDHELWNVRDTVDVESELIQLRWLLLPHDMQQQQLQLSEHVERLMELTSKQLAEVLEESFLCGMLDVAQLQQLHKLLPLQRSDATLRQPLTSFYRRLTAELPQFRYDMSLPRHIEFLQRYLMLRELNPKPQGRRLLNASMEYMTQLQLPQLTRFLDTFNPAQLQQLTLHLSCSYIQLPWRQQQRLHQTALRVRRGKPMLQLSQCNANQLMKLLSTPVDEPMTMQQRRYLQSLLDHLLPMPKLKQLRFLQSLGLNNSRVRRFRLILHNPALLCDPLQLKQLYLNLKQLTQLLSHSP